MGPQDLGLIPGAVGVVGAWGKEELGKEGGEETGKRTALLQPQLILLELDPLSKPLPPTP